MQKKIPEKFEIDSERLSDEEEKKLNQLKEEYKKLEDLPENFFLTPEEHLWHTSTPSFLESYPLSPNKVDCLSRQYFSFN